MKFLLLQDTTRTQRMAGTKQSAVSMYRTGSRSWSAAPTLPLHATTMKDVLGYRLVSSPVQGWPFHARFFSVLLRVANFCMREQHRRAAVCGSTPAVPGTARTLADELPTVIRLRCWGSLERRPVVDIPHDRCLTRYAERSRHCRLDLAALKDLRGRNLCAASAAVAALRSDVIHRYPLLAKMRSIG